MNFIVFAGAMVMLLSVMGWAFLTTGFIKFRRREWLVLWLFIGTVVFATYLFAGRVDSGLPSLVREQLVNAALFWLVLQAALIVFFPIWFGVAFFRWIGKKKGKENELLWQRIGRIVLIFAVTISIKAVYFPDPWEIANVDIVSEQIPPELEGMKIAQITDTHILHRKHLERVRAQVAGAVASEADILIMTGDFVDGMEYLPEAAQIFKDAEKKFPLGIWFTLGNHEYIRGVEPFLKTYEEKGLPLLKNSGVTLAYHGAPFYLAGVDYPFPQSWREGQGGGASADLAVAKKDLAEALKNRQPGEFTILAAHHPIIFDEAAKEGIVLSFAGHTHGYQIGFQRKSLNVFAKYAWGLYGDDQGYGYVSSGAGEWFPVRLGAPEEIVIFTLKRPQK